MNITSMTLARLTAAALLATACIGGTQAQSAASKTLRFVPHADLKILDPTFTTAYISRNFGYMVYDTLFAQDAKGHPKPQMVDKWSTSKDGKEWTFTLRPGLKFSDGSAVTAADAVASLQRWAARDTFGTAMKAFGAEWSAVDANTFKLSLKEPFGMVLDALAKPSGFPPVVMPEKLARLPTTSPISEVLGSGPFVFKRDEWVPGSKIVFVKNPLYVPRNEPASGMAGSKKTSFDRVEWLYLPDANSSVAALKKGEVDYIEQVPPDYVTPLRTDANVKLYASSAQQAQLIMNQLHPPFNNPKVRQAVMKAVSQEKFNAAMGYPLDMRMSYCATYFICGSANDTTAGADPYRTPDTAKAKQMLAEAGYKGEKVILLVASDVPYLNALSLMSLQTMKSIGLNVEGVTMDWASIGARRAKRDAPESGGWSAYATVANEFAINSPIVSTYLSAPCGNTLPGWPCDKPLDELRAAWVKETVPAKRKELLDAFQRRAFEAVPYINLGQYSAASAARKELKGADKMWGGMPNVWVMEK
jgi:peptide/nickel transport system substrate-binding protein